MLEIRTRLMLPMPAANSALSKALSGVPPSAFPAVPAAIVTSVHPMRSSSRLLALGCVHRGPRSVVNFPLIVAAQPRNASKKLLDDALRGALPRLARRRENPREGHFLLAMPKKLAHSEQNFCPKKFRVRQHRGGGKECTHWGDTCCSSCSTATQTPSTVWTS